MKFIESDRRYSVGKQKQIEIADKGSVTLSPDEQVTFLTESGGEVDVTRKSWGFYAASSLTERLPSFGLNAALVEDTGSRRFFLMLVEKDKEGEFRDYLKGEGLVVVRWLNNFERCRAVRPSRLAMTAPTCGKCTDPAICDQHGCQATHGN